MSLDLCESLVYMQRYSAFEMIYILINMILEFCNGVDWKYSMERSGRNVVCIHLTIMVKPAFSSRGSADLNAAGFVRIGGVIVEIFDV